MSARQIELTEQKTQLIAYLQSKVKAGDWHAVQDAASDIREIDARLDESSVFAALSEFAKAVGL